MKEQAQVGPEGDTPQPLVAHLTELRSRLLRSVSAILLVLLVLAPFARTLYSLLATPLQKLLPLDSSMIATEVASPFLAPFKLVLVGAVFITAPYLLYQVWSFIAPGMYRHEKRFALGLLISSIFLFYLGAVFAYYAVLPLVFSFFTAAVPEGVRVMTDIHHYLNFVLKMFFAFGVAFEIPVAVVLAVRAGLTTAERLASARPYVIVGCFVIGMLLTPPDIISQTLLALPAWLLFEVGILTARRLQSKID